MVKGIIAYIVTDGNGQDAVKFYEDALDAQVLSLQTFGDMPENPDHPTPPEAKDRVLHAHLRVGENELMLSDTFPGSSLKLGDQVGIAVMISTPEKTKDVFGKLSIGGHVTMELQQTFWSPLYGQVQDKFGVTWQVSTLNQDE
ncbi:VOC family protein [Terribacillus sp. 179-K 1B1 HS]|uniref:VOC family protein n=1 Tax=Terribacillus sp. 179-K 1B1 HS TaxID=3142388 RepID=UPI0039A117F2